MPTLYKTDEIEGIIAVEEKWYKNYKKYHTTADILSDSSLINFKKDKTALFRYIHLRESKLRRIPNSLYRRFRRLINHPAGRTMGLMNVYSTKAMLNLVNGLCKKIGEVGRLKKPYPILVTSIIRTVEHQKHLKKIGFPTTDNSTHCNGYAADIEQLWLRENRPEIYVILNNLLNRYKEMGVVNLINYGDFYHVSLNPQYIEDFTEKEYI